MPEKTCKRCGETKDIQEFYRHGSTSDGHAIYCKSCKLQRVRERRRRESAAKRDRDERAATREVTPLSDREMVAVEAMAENILAFRGGELEVDGTGSPVIEPCHPVDELAQEKDLSGRRWHRLCTIALDIADAREDAETDHDHEDMEAAA